jgi:hypothetical protein
MRLLSIVVDSILVATLATLAFVLMTYGDDAPQFLRALQTTAVSIPGTPASGDPQPLVTQGSPQ